MTAILKNKKGVTLVELLAVIVIMGIIAAIAVPAISGLINRQKMNAAEASYDLIAEVAVNYAQAESDNTVKISELVTAEYLESNPFNEDATLTISGTTVTFVIDAPATVFTTLDGAVEVTAAGVASMAD